MMDYLAGVRDTTVGTFFGEVECDVIIPLADASFILGRMIAVVGSKFSSFTFMRDFGDVTLRLCPPFREIVALICF